MLGVARSIFFRSSEYSCHHEEATVVTMTAFLIVMTAHWVFCAQTYAWDGVGFGIAYGTRCGQATVAIAQLSGCSGRHILWNHPIFLR
jgi:hypothetical protein